MIKIGVKVEGLDRVKAHLQGQAKQVAFATAVALTRTAQVIKDAMPGEMRKTLDRPTQFTTGGMFLRKANKNNLEAVVGFKDLQAGYMRYQIEGGVRQAGRAGIKLPGNIELNAFGNIPKGLISRLKAAAQRGDLSGAIRKRLGVDGNRRKGASPIQLFYGKPQGKGWEKAPMGIWRRVPGTPGKLIPVIVFEDTPARYTKRFDFHGIAKRIVDREWNAQFARALSEAMRSAK